MTELTTTTINATAPRAYLATHRSITGRAGMVSALNNIAAIVTDGATRDWQALDWTRLTPEAAQVIRAKLTGAPATVNKSLSALRGVAMQLFSQRHISADDLQRIKNATKAVKGSRLASGRDAEAWEIAELIRTCAKDPTPAGIRDAAMIALAAKTGARREEIVSIELANIRQVEDGAEIKIIGKGDKERTLFVDAGAWRQLQDWLAIRGTEGSFLFCPINKGGRMNTSKGITTTSAHEMFVKRCKEAGVENLHWHDLRRTVAGELLDAGEDISTVASVLGHSDVRTTARYDRRPDREKRRAVRKIKVQYVKPKFELNS